jgi:hypothetical protein
MNTRPKPNTAAIKNLKDQGFSVKIIHYRRKKWKDKLEPLIQDRAIRENIKRGGFGYEMVSERGGSTEICLTRGEEKIVIRADCYVGDAFCKKIGTRVALDKLKKLYDINA